MGNVIQFNPQRLDIRKGATAGTAASSGGADVVKLPGKDALPDLPSWQREAREAFNALEWEAHGRHSDYAAPVKVHLYKKDMIPFMVELKRLLKDRPYSFGVQINQHPMLDGKYEVFLRVEWNKSSA
jgi:hypothetical protein